MAPLGASFSSLENELDLETSFYFKESSLEMESSFFSVEISGDPLLTSWLGLISSIVSRVGDTDLRYDVIRRALLSSQNPRPQSNQENPVTQIWTEGWSKQYQAGPVHTISRWKTRRDQESIHSQTDKEPWWLNAVWHPGGVPGREKDVHRKTENSEYSLHWSVLVV